MMLQDVIKSKLELLPIDVNILAVNGALLEVCNPQWLKVGDSVFDSVIAERKIIEVGERFIKLDAIGFDDSTVKKIPLKKPTFIWGVPIEANNEYTLMADFSIDKSPLIWLLEPWTEDYKPSEGMELSADVRMFILDVTNEPVWVNEEQKVYALKPMKALSKAVVSVLKKQPLGWNVEKNGFSLIQRNRFGVQRKDGNTKKIIDEDLSGWEIKITNPLIPNFDCEC